MKLELLTREPEVAGCATPILFVHGAWHGAWCWDRHFLPYFAERGFTVYALSFRNHGESDHVGSLRWKRGADYVADVRQAVKQIERMGKGGQIGEGDQASQGKQNGKSPVLVGHSLGGYVVQKYLERWDVPGAVLVSSVPPHGAFGATLRTFRHHPWAFLKANLTLRLWPIIGSPRLTRDAFFSKGMPEEQVRAYYSRMQDESYLAYLDMLFLNLPRAGRVSRTPRPMLVLGGAADAIVSPAEMRATSRAYSAEFEIFAGMPHDLMLDEGWQMAADRIIEWLEGLPGIC